MWRDICLLRHFFPLLSGASDCPDWCEVHARDGAFCVVGLHHNVWVSAGPVCHHTSVMMRLCFLVPDGYEWLFLLPFSPCRLLDRVPSGTPFIILCFLVRSIDAVGFAAAMTSSFAMTAKIFPNNVATVLVSADKPCAISMLPGHGNHGKTKKHYCHGCFVHLLVS